MYFEVHLFKSIVNGKINKILIVQTAFLGDVILITPLIRETKKLFPSATLDVMVIPQTEGALKNNPYINNIILFDKRKNKITSFAKTLFRIKKEKYDVAITPHSSLTTAWLLYYGGIKKRIGFDRWKASKYLTDKVPHREGIHKRLKNLELLSVFTNENLEDETELFPSKKDFEIANKELQILKQTTKNLIAVAPGSVWFTKRWPEEYYKKLIGKLSEENFGIVLIGSKDEYELCERIKPEKNVVNLAGKLSVLQSAAAISMCDLTVCNDSGVLHISNAVKTDVFAFFGPTVQSIGYFPYRKNDYVFEINLDCRPCGSHGGKKCPLGHHDCMRKIYPETVFEKIKEKFS